MSVYLSLSTRFGITCMTLHYLPSVIFRGRSLKGLFRYLFHAYGFSLETSEEYTFSVRNKIGKVLQWNTCCRTVTGAFAFLFLLSVQIKLGRRCTSVCGRLTIPYLACFLRNPTYIPGELKLHLA